MKTFSIQVLGCKVNQYEAEQIAALLRARGLIQQPDGGDLRIIHTCGVTREAASKSRQAVRRTVRLPLLATAGLATEARSVVSSSIHPSASTVTGVRTLVTGCWATSDPSAAGEISGVGAVLTNHQNLTASLSALLARWLKEDGSPPPSPTQVLLATAATPEPSTDDGWMNQAGVPGSSDSDPITTIAPLAVKHEIDSFSEEGWGTTALPVPGQRQTGHQRAFLKIQDGCDAHCTYCIIPQLRPGLWSKPMSQVVEEARRLIEAGHVEIVLTGIFLGAYGHETALRRRQAGSGGLAPLIDALCTQVPGLQRLRLSSLEPGDLTEELLGALRARRQVVPHFHLPLQSGSDELLRRMNRQYRQADFLTMVERVRRAFDRPALTTDIIVGFPGETDDRFQRTLEVVKRVGFMQVHAFPYSPRPGTAAARWTKEAVPPAVVKQRLEILAARSRHHDLEFRRQFVGETVPILVEKPGAQKLGTSAPAGWQHGRGPRYFPIFFQHSRRLTGQLVQVRIERVTPRRTVGVVVDQAS